MMDRCDGTRRTRAMAKACEGISTEALEAGATPQVVGAPIGLALAEVSKAVTKFPTWPTDPIHAAAVLNEEVGELNKAVLQAVYEPHKSGPDDVKAEAVQVAAMALRFLASLSTYQYAPGEQHDQPVSAVTKAPS